MRDQYAGDISDLLKFALLRKLGADDKTIGVGWYYNPTHDGRPDGRHREYCDETKWGSFDLTLWNALRKLPEQSVAALEKLPIWPTKTRFHRVPVPSTGNRQAWASDMGRALQEASIVFLDPDNGVGRTSERHATLSEVAAMRRQGRAVVLIKFPGHHQKHARQIEEYHNMLRDQAGAVSVVTVRTCVWLQQPRSRWFTILDADGVLIGRAKEFANRVNGIDKCSGDFVCGPSSSQKREDQTRFATPTDPYQVQPFPQSPTPDHAVGNLCPECGHQFKGNVSAVSKPTRRALSPPPQALGRRVAPDTALTFVGFVSSVPISSLTVEAAGLPIIRDMSFGGTSTSTTPFISPNGIVPLYSVTATIEPGEWVSLYGNKLASSTTVWNGDFPISLGGTSVTVDGKAVYLWFVSPGQINFQAPNDLTVGVVPVVVTTAAGSVTSQVTLSTFAPSFSLLDSSHVAGIILRSNGSGAYGGGTYDIIGPTESSLAYVTVPAKPGDSLELFGVGFGPTNPVVPAGQPYTGAAATTNSVQLAINGVTVIPSFAGLSSAGLYQVNFTMPPAIGTGDVSLVAAVGGVQTQSGVVISLQ